MRGPFRYLFWAGLAASGLYGPVLADSIVDPDGTSADAVSAFDSGGVPIDLSATGDIGGGTLRIGNFSGDAGTLEVNAAALANGVTALTNIDDLQLAPFGPGDSLLRVRGDDTAGSASVTVADDLRLGANADSRLEILDGGVLTRTGPATGRAGQAILGSYTDFRPGSGDTTTIVDGEGSLFEVNGRLSLGFSNGAGVDSLTISNGARVLVHEPDDFAARATGASDVTENTSGDFVLEGDFNVGAAQATDRLTVTGSGSELVVSSGLFTSGGKAIVDVTNGGAIRQVERGDIDSMAAAYPGVFDSGSFGLGLASAFGEATMNVDGTGSVVSFTRDITLGAGDVFVGFDADSNPLFAPSTATLSATNGALVETTRRIEVSDVDGEGTGFLNVASGATVSADEVRVNGGGVLSGDGGMIAANIILNGGTIAPGASPGIMTIDGDLTVLDGLLTFEIAGTAPGLFDQLIVNGDLDATGPLDLEISFLSGFIPSVGDMFDLLSVAGAAPIFDTPDLINVTLLGLPTGTDFALDFSGGGITGVVHPTAAVPLPATLPILLTALGGLFLLRRRR